MSADEIPDTPLLSICIPHFNRSPHLAIALEVLARQSDRDLEVCISDDASTDDPQRSIEQWLSASGLAYRYERQPAPLRYDANLRRAIGLARGRYVLLMGNDDCLIDADAVARIRAALSNFDWPEVLVMDYADWNGRAAARRVRHSGVAGSGPSAVARQFRNVSFVSGLVFDRAAAQAVASSAADGSEMYQMYLLAAVVRGSARIATLAEALVLKDIEVPGVHVASHRDEPRDARCSFEPRSKPMCRIPEAIQSGFVAAGELAEPALARVMADICAQLYRFTYPYWLMRFRELRGVCHAIGFARALAPSRTCRNVRMSGMAHFKLRCLLAAATLVCVFVPVRAFHRVRPMLYRLAKS